MQHRVALFALLLAACASSQQDSSGPPVTVQLAQLNGTSNIFYYPGPVNVQYQVAVNNPTDQQITLRRLDLRTEGFGAYALRTTGTPMNVKIATEVDGDVHDLGVGTGERRLHRLHRAG